MSGTSFKFIVSIFLINLTFTLQGWTQTPTASDDRVNAAQNGPSIEIRVLNNDSFGPDGPNDDHALTFTNGSKESASAKGASIKVDNNGTPTIYDDDFILYTPSKSFIGEDSFTYVITDADGDADRADVTITVSSSYQSFTEYIEEFDNPGEPQGPSAGHYWNYFNDIYPDQDTWTKMVPGDGYAYLTVDPDITNDTDATNPYQTLVFGKVGEGNRIEVRMKGAVVDGGLVCFLFTYSEIGDQFNEVDIELVANDANGTDPGHDIYPPNGWTDARFNTWRDASTTTFLPISSTFHPIVDSNNKKVSLLDDEFHTYTIDWAADQVDFYIDDVLQESFTTNVAKGMSEVIIGYRNLVWAGDFNWTGTHNLVIDYFKVQLLSSLSAESNKVDDFSDLQVFPNPASNFIQVKCKDFYQIESMEISNVLGKQLTSVKGYQKQFDISSFPAGMYFVSAIFSNGARRTKKVVKY